MDVSLIIFGSNQTIMKRTNILYWVFTGLFSAAMLLSAVTNIMVTPESVDLIVKQLGYPIYFVSFVGYAKALGVIAILIPGYPRIKEWAYAGLFFDLSAATFSIIAATEFQPSVLGMALFFVLGGLSYFFYHKKLKG
jgi:DoxX-like family